MTTLNFTNTNGTTLVAHDAKWLIHAGWPASEATIQSNRATGTGSVSTAYRYNESPATDDYDVTGTFYIADTNTTHNAGVMARLRVSPTYGYMARYRRGTGVQLFKFVASATSVQLGTTVAGDVAVGSSITLRLRCQGTTITVFKDGTPVISVTDSAVNTGLPGLWISGAGAGTGVQPTEFSFGDIPTAPTTATLTGPSTGTTGAASSNFTITLDQPATSTVTFTPAGTVGSVTFSPSAPQIAIGSSTVTFTATPASDGAHVITTTNDGGLSNVGAVTYTTSTAGDVTPPTLSSPAGTGGALVCSGSVSTNEANGTLYVVATASATAPTKAQVKAGQDHTGAAALRVVSQAVSATGSQAVASGSVTAGTRYLHFMHEDAAANQSDVVSSASFVVSSLPTITTDALRDESNALRASHTVAKVVATRLSDLVQVCTWANQVTSAGGVLTLSHASLTAVPHIVTTASADGSAAGAKVYTPA